MYFHTVVDCGPLTNPLNGQVNTSSGTTYNEVAAYSCDPGYYIIGSSSRTCQVNGAWNSTVPSCEREFLPELYLEDP